jgi:PAS domain S-box-containing protein
MRSIVSAEEKLQMSELRYRRLFETAQDGILILHGGTGKIMDVNPFLLDLLGYEKRELIGKQLRQIGGLKDAIDSKAAFKQLQNEGCMRFSDFPLQTKQKKSIAIEFVSNAYVVAGERVIQCNIRDISDRKKAEVIVKKRTEELEKLGKAQEMTKLAMLNVMEDLEVAKLHIEREKAKSEAMLASIGEGLIAVDNRKRIIAVNRPAEEMLGWKMEEMMGRDVTSFPLEDGGGNRVSMFKRPIRKALAIGNAARSNYFFVRKDGTKFPTVIDVRPIKLNDKIIGAIDIFRDITDEKEIDRAKSEFVSLASHQLRTPLGITKWYLEALVKFDHFGTAPEGFKEYFEEVRKSNERVLSMVRDLLSVSRIDQGRVKDNPAIVDLAEIVTEVMEQMKILAHERKIVLHLKIMGSGVKSVYVDALRMHEVIENLLSNAIEYMVNPGTIEILVKKQGKHFLLAIKDEGIGISIADQKNLYTKFFRSEKAVTHNPEGSGLGLYVVKSYVEAWGGKVFEESKEGFGSVFTVSLPIQGE